MTPEELDRELAAIPAGSTMMLDPGRDPARPEVRTRRAWPLPGEYACARGCGANTVMPGICVACGSKERRAEARREFAPALDSIPLAFRWATPRDAKTLGDRVRPIHVTRGGSVADLAEQIAIGVGSGGRPFWTLRGETGSGKTSIACAALTALCEAGIEAWLRVPIPGSRRSASGRHVNVEPTSVRMARGARFVAAVDLMPPTDRADERPAMFGMARRASVLVLDDVGKELSAREDAMTTALRAATTRELIEHRWNARLPTVITTALDDDAIVSNYDGGTFRRVIEDRQVKCLDWGGT